MTTDESAASTARVMAGSQLRFIRMSIVADPSWGLWLRASLPITSRAIDDAAVDVFACHDVRCRPRTSLYDETVVGMPALRGHRWRIRAEWRVGA